jgi:hypothetical protein
VRLADAAPAEGQAVTAKRGKCRAVSCRAARDCLVLLRVASDTGNPRYLNVGLCRKHTRAWLDHLDHGTPPVEYKRWERVVEVLP